MKPHVLMIKLSYCAWAACGLLCHASALTCVLKVLAGGKTVSMSSKSTANFCYFKNSPN